MRRPFKLRHPHIKADEKYNSILVSKLIQYTMKDGKKSLAKQIVYDALSLTEKECKKPALAIFEEAIQNISPLLEVKSRRIGGATYQIPVEVDSKRKTVLALRWILDASRSKQGKPMADFLSQEIIDSYNKTGSSIKKREDMHKTAEANRAFAHYARF